MPDLTRQRPSAGNVIDASFGTPILEARNLRFVRNEQTLIDDVTVRLRAARRTVIIGPNGAGKSLLLRLMHGLIKPCDGQVIWQGRPAGVAMRDAQALVFQKPVMLRRSVLSNLRFALAARGIGGRERARRARQALEAADLQDLAHRPARVLSGGEQQRLAIARALACGPDLLFLDEPTASLDPAATARIEAQINQAHASGVTIVMVTHDQGQARRLADDVVFLQNGRVAEAGSAAKLLNDPVSGAARAWLEGRLYLPDSAF
jgi:tungstate transport system ATP-binding protein